MPGRQGDDLKTLSPLISQLFMGYYLNGRELVFQTRYAGSIPVYPSGPVRRSELLH